MNESYVKSPECVLIDDVIIKIMVGNKPIVILKIYLLTILR